MILGILSKAVRRVKGHIRKRKPVRAYVRRGKDAIKRQSGQLFQKHYKQINKWTWQSVFHQIGKGVHVRSVDDAFLAGIEAAFLNIKNYRHRKGSLATYMRPTIKYAILKHIAWERSKGMTGVRTIYNKLYAAKGDAERTKIMEEFPQMTALSGQESAPSIEEILDGSRALFKRDEALDIIERDFGVSIRKVKGLLEDREKGKQTWKQTNLVKKKIHIYELHVFDNKPLREVARRLDMDPKNVRTYFNEVQGFVKKHWGLRVNKALTQDQKGVRLALAFKRLQTARENGFPQEHIEFIKDVLVGIMFDLGLGEKE